MIFAILTNFVIIRIIIKKIILVDNNNKFNIDNSNKFNFNNN